MLVNFSNHPSGKWSDEQKNAALNQFGNVIDYPFPEIDPEASSSVVQRLAKQYFQKITQEFTENISIHVMGELTFCYNFICECDKHSIDCFASTTNRTVINNENGIKTTVFSFVGFRKYFK